MRASTGTIASRAGSTLNIDPALVSSSGVESITGSSGSEVQPLTPQNPTSMLTAIHFVMTSPRLPAHVSESVIHKYPVDEFLKKLRVVKTTLFFDWHGRELPQ